MVLFIFWKVDYLKSNINTLNNINNKRETLITI